MYIRIEKRANDCEIALVCISIHAKLEPAISHSEME